jgi:8-oxo-dGTP pyrophosphatase MutT (NUDIX family)
VTDAGAAKPAVPAATVVLLRPAADGGEPGVECLMLHKNRGQAFGGMWVFPGGKVEPGDERPDAGEHDDARRCAVREAAEETGLALGDADLVPFAHWMPPPEAPRRYSTWFFVAALPPGAAEVIVDGGEIGDHVWTTPGAALERHAAGEIDLAPPTWITLHELGEAATPADAVERARREPIAFYSTRIVGGGADLVALWEPDAGYDTGDLDAPGPRHRLRMTAAGGWGQERTD